MPNIVLPNIRHDCSADYSAETTFGRTLGHTFSGLSVDGFGINFDGLLTWVMVKSLQNFIKFGQQTAKMTQLLKAIYANLNLKDQVY